VRSARAEVKAPARFRAKVTQTVSPNPTRSVGQNVGPSFVPLKKKLMSLNRLQEKYGNLPLSQFADRRIAVTPRRMASGQLILVPPGALNGFLR
jgi:hypothetical protein